MNIVTPEFLQMYKVLEDVGIQLSECSITSISSKLTNMFEELNKALGRGLVRGKQVMTISSEQHGRAICLDNRGLRATVGWRRKRLMAQRLTEDIAQRVITALSSIHRSRRQQLYFDLVKDYKKVMSITYKMDRNQSHTATFGIKAGINPFRPDTETYIIENISYQQHGNMLQLLVKFKNNYSYSMFGFDGLDISLAITLINTPEFPLILDKLNKRRRIETRTKARAERVLKYISEKYSAYLATNALA